ncbi:MAG: response regulator transcription factor [Chloroflexi bacterium]|nr:response regulator transcription factor [Chloroflexota bacterium]
MTVDIAQLDQLAPLSAPKEERDEVGELTTRGGMASAPISRTRASGAKKIKVVIIEDEDSFRDTLQVVVSQHSRLEVSGAFSNRESALAALLRLRPQIAFINIDLGTPRAGIAFALELRRTVPDLGIVLLSNQVDPRFVASVPVELLSSCSFLLRGSVNSVKALRRSIARATSRLVVSDNRSVSKQARAKVLMRTLTPRQTELLGLIAEGLSNGAIAQRMGLVEKTVENHVNLLYHRVGINRHDPSSHPRVKLVLLYLQSGRLRRSNGATP